MTPARLALLWGVSAVALVGVAALSAVPMPAEEEYALIRMSWRAPGIAIQECRTLTEEELAALPSHMRRAEECTGRNADFVLTVAVESLPTTVDTIRPAGARGDRPIYVSRELRVPPGSHRLRVTFEPQLPPAADTVPDRSLALSATVDVQSGEIALVTTDDAVTRLEVRPSDRVR